MKRYGKKKLTESGTGTVLLGYRWGIACVAALLLLIAGVMIYEENSESVLQERRTASDWYTFSFLTQENEPVSRDQNTMKDTAVRPVVDSDEVYYSDSFFDVSNDKYNHGLARASLALSMTAFEKKYVMSFMENLGFRNLAAYRYNQTGDDDKVALVMGHKFMADTALSDVTGAESVKNIIAVAIRGGKYGDEWGSNGRVGYDGDAFGYHYGFHKAAGDAIVQLKEYAADNDMDLSDSVIWITGFSRGAAVANVMGAMLTGTGAGTESAGGPAIISPDNLFDYTFASPNTVSARLIMENESESALMDVNYRGIYNIVNPLDIVTRLPMKAGGVSETADGKKVKYNWDYIKYGMTLNLPTESESAQMQVVQLLENALAFASRNESKYVEQTQDQVIIPALKKTMGKGADVSKRNIGYVLVDALPGVTTFLKKEVNQLDLRAQIYVAGILSGKTSIRLEKEHWPETYWGWMVKVDDLE